MDEDEEATRQQQQTISNSIVTKQCTENVKNVDDDGGGGDGDGDDDNDGSGCGVDVGMDEEKIVEIVHIVDDVVLKTEVIENPKCQLEESVPPTPKTSTPEKFLENVTKQITLTTTTLPQTTPTSTPTSSSQPPTLMQSSPASLPAQLVDCVVDDDEVVEATAVVCLAADTESLMQREPMRLAYENELNALRATLAQKDNMITLFQRENTILENEKNAFRKEMELANKEKEATVIKFATKEKLLLDAKKAQEAVEKQLADSKKEVKNISIRFQAVKEEKGRISYMMIEKCNELRKSQRECEKWKADCGHLESKLKYHVNKLSLELEAKQALERKLEEERNAPNKLEEKANEKLKMEMEANTILLKHEIVTKTEMFDNLNREYKKQNEQVKQLQEQLTSTSGQLAEVTQSMTLLQEEYNAVQNSYSEEILNSAKLRGQLDELLVLRTQNTLNEEKIENLTAEIAALQAKQQDNEQDLHELHKKEEELLSINKEMSESIVTLQNEICLLKAKSQAIEAENELLKKEQSAYDGKYEDLQAQLQSAIEQKSEERQLLAKHLSEKTKLYEMTQVKLDNVLGDFEANKHKQANVVKELQRELQKAKKMCFEQQQPRGTLANFSVYCSNCGSSQAMTSESSMMEQQQQMTNKKMENGHGQQQRSSSRNSIRSGGSGSSGGGGSVGDGGVPAPSGSSRRPSDESSESETVASSSNTAIQNDLQGPSKKHLIDRILRLQQASARQTEKIDFLENHTLSLVAELQKKSKVVQYYMLRDQAGALTSSKSDQNKSELAKYGSGVMSAIYNGLKKGDDGSKCSMTLELSLEINKKLQAVLEDTLLKNITLKENLDVLGLEVDNLMRKIRKLETKE